MTHAPSPVAYTVDTRTADGYLIQRDARPHSPWYAYTPGRRRRHLHLPRLREHRRPRAPAHRPAPRRPTPRRTGGRAPIGVGTAGAMRVSQATRTSG